MSLRMKGKGKRSDGLEGHKNGSKRARNGHANGCEKLFRFSPDLKRAESSLADAWRASKMPGSQPDDDQSISGDITLVRYPFPCCVAKNVISNEDVGPLLEKLQKELEDVEMADKSNDLYKFKQSASDLRHVRDEDAPHVAGLRSMLESEAREWLQNVTGIELAASVDMFCAKYGYTDHLLCHDDELEGRRIAYIMYFVKNWTKVDGGTLDLFDTDELGRPADVVKSLIPSTNSLVFFEVTEKSFHQVAEVLTKDKTRLSIGGWFHGASIERLPRASPRPPGPLEGPEDISEDEFYAWINPMYLDPEIQLEINAKFEASSEISLPNFLDEDKFKEVCAALALHDGWKKCGPADSRNYGTIPDGAGRPDVVRDCVKFLRSDATFLMLSTMTGLRLHPLAPENDDDDESDSEGGENGQNGHTNGDGNIKASTSTAEVENGFSARKRDEGREFDPGCSIQVRRWRPGCYTLLNDRKAADNRRFCLETRLFFNCDDWSIESGGFTSFVARDEDEELLTAMPENNTLTIVYKDTQTLGFVKYCNDGLNSMPNGEFHDISATYYE